MFWQYNYVDELVGWFEASGFHEYRKASLWP